MPCREAGLFLAISHHPLNFTCEKADVAPGKEGVGGDEITIFSYVCA